MTVSTQEEINVLMAECSAIEAQLLAKRKDLESAVMSKLTADGKQHPLSSFLGTVATYDRPHKWQAPRSSVLTEDDLKHYGYLSFNGIVTGAQVNSLYHEPCYDDNDTFYSFAIPEEWSEVPEGHRIPIEEVYELLIFKIQ